MTANPNSEDEARPVAHAGRREEPDDALGAIIDIARGYVTQPGMKTILELAQVIASRPKAGPVAQIEYSSEMGQAAQDYINECCRFADGSYAITPPSMPGTFRWQALFERMLDKADPVARVAMTNDERKLIQEVADYSPVGKDWHDPLRDWKPRARAMLGLRDDLEQGIQTMTGQKVSKLAELTRDQVVALQVRFSSHKSRWRSRLLEDFATGKDQNSPALRQLRNERLPWLQTVTSADFELPIVVHYGTIACERGAEPALAALGVEVGDYDYKQGRYYVRVNAAAYKELAPYPQDFPLDALHAFDDNTHLPRDLSQCETSLLKAAAAHYAYRIHSEECDDRVTAGGSAELDWWLEQAEKIDMELAARARASAAPPAGQPVAAETSPAL